MRFLTNILLGITLLAGVVGLTAFQQPQAPSGTPIFNANAKYTNGVAPGYWPTAGTGLVLNISSGTAYCSTGNIVPYAGGTLTLAANNTNYVYLNVSASCVPASNTTGFALNQIPLATVITGSSSITSIVDDRTLFINPQASGSFSLTTTGTSGASTLIGSTLNVPQYQGAISFTTTGTSGAATFAANALNIPQYQGVISLTTTGTSGAATLSSNTLNIPQYAGAISSVSNSDSTLTISPTTGAVVASLTLSHANTWTAKQSQPAPLFTNVTGSTQCIHVDSTGQVSGTGSDCGSGAGGDTITSPQATLTIGGSPTNTTLDVAPVNTVVDISTPVTVSTTKPAEFHFNENATAATAVTYNLPTAAAGKQFCFGNAYNGSAPNTGVLTLTTSAAGQFIIFTDGTLSATGGNVTSGGAAADAACLVGVDSTHWYLYVQAGTWTKH